MGEAPSDPLAEFPRQLARTRHFALGVPRSFTVSPDGSSVVFLRTRSGDDPVTCLWVLDVATDRERCVVDPRTIGDEGDDAALTEAERSRRERVREMAGGIVSYATDREARRAVFALSGRLFLVDLAGGDVRELPAAGGVDDPRLDPSGARVAYVCGGALHVVDLDGAGRVPGRVLAAEDDPAISWGLAEFAASEEMRRLRGHWWSPDGGHLAATRVDERPVAIWWIGDPTDASAAPRSVRYPAAGTDDAIVTLHLFDVGTGGRVDVEWDREAFPYLARVYWSEGSPLTLLVQSRDQRRTRLLEVDARTGAATLVREDADDRWIDLAEDAPVRLSDGRLVTVVAGVDANRLAIDGNPVTPPDLQVREVLAAGDGVLFTASEDPTEVHLWRWTRGGGPVRLSRGPGVHAGAGDGDVTVLVSSTIDESVPRISVLRGGNPVAKIDCPAERPVVEPRPVFLTLGEHDLRVALFLPAGREPDAPIPVLMDPYGGPHFGRVVRSRGEHLTSQWFADHGFAVLVVDGRGTPGRGPVWDREVYRDFTRTLDDQVEALHAAAERHPFLDLSRVGIRGWSFGGYLSAMAVLRRPDLFHAAVAGAPVTDWRLYDTHYTERYLGRPDEEPEVYERNSLLRDAAGLSRPLLLIHGLADDNVVVAHTLRLSAALFEAGRFHELVLLPNATHLTRSEAITENVLWVQLEFLRRTLGVGTAPRR